LRPIAVIYVCDRNEPEQVAEQLLTETAEGDGALGRG
jgi:hypothetical protein